MTRKKGRRHYSRNTTAGGRRLPTWDDSHADCLPIVFRRITFWFNQAIRNGDDGLLAALVFLYRSLDDQGLRFAEASIY